MYTGPRLPEKNVVRFSSMHIWSATLPAVSAASAAPAVAAAAVMARFSVKGQSEIT